MINVAIVGVGGIAQEHIKGLLLFKNRCQIVALVDIFPEKALEAKKKYELNCEVFDSHKKMLEANLHIDLVHVCTPPYVHSSISIDAMNGGCNVLVEKPMATSLLECDEMLETEERNGVTLACIAQNRFRNSIYKLKELADSQLAGNIRFADIKSYWWRGHSYYDLWWRGTWEKEGGGPTLNHAVHHIDMINWMKGELPCEVTAVLGNVMHDNSEVEDISVAILRYADGALGKVTSSVVHHGEEQGIELQCEKAKISAPFSCVSNKSQSNGFPSQNEELEQEIKVAYDQMPDLLYEGHAGEIEHVLTALETNQKPMITGIDGKRTLELITAIYKSGCSKQTVCLPITKEDEYYTFEGIMKNAVRFYEKTTSVVNFDTQEISVGNYK